MKDRFLTILLICLTVSLSHPAWADGDSLKTKKPFKNTIRFNLTNPMIFGEKSIFIGYERTIGKHQSFSVNGGRASFPKISFDVLDSAAKAKLNIEKDYKDLGYTFTVDYRFYLKKENKYISPRGVYIGPYFSLTHFERENNWSMHTTNFSGNVKTDLTFNIQMMGVQMGYQFILWERVALDFILIGPGIALYKIKAGISTDLSGEDASELLQRLHEGLLNRFPAYSYIIDQAEFEKSGSSNTTSMGFRYVIHLGFRF